MRILIAVLTVMLVGCATTGDRVRRLQPGLTTAQVVEELGRPDGVQTVGEYTVYTYANRLMSGWSWDRADYHIVFQDDRVVQYGPGTVRQGSQVGTIVIIPPGR